MGAFDNINPFSDSSSDSGSGGSGSSSNPTDSAAWQEITESQSSSSGSAPSARSGGSSSGGVSTPDRRRSADSDDGGLFGAVGDAVTDAAENLSQELSGTQGQSGGQGKGRATDGETVQDAGESSNTGGTSSRRRRKLEQVKERTPETADPTSTDRISREDRAKLAGADQPTDIRPGLKRKREALRRAPEPASAEAQMAYAPGQQQARQNVANFLSSGGEGPVTERIGRRFDSGAEQVEEYGRMAKRGATRAYSDTAGYADYAAGSTDEALGRGGQEFARGDVAGGFDEAAGGMDEAVAEVATREPRDRGRIERLRAESRRQLARGNFAQSLANAPEILGYSAAAADADALAGRTDEYVAQAEVNQEVATDLTRGGLLPEEKGGPLGISEADLKRASEDVSSFKESFDENPPVTVMGSDLPERALQGPANAGVALLNLPSWAMKGETALEVGQNAPGVVQEQGVGAVAGTVTAVGRETGEYTAQRAKSSPVEFATGAAFSYASGAAFSRALGRAGRVGKDRLRTVGGTKVDPTDLTNKDTVDYYEGRNTDPENRFPGAENPQKYRNEPASAVREQAERYTPDRVQEFFQKRGVTEGSVLKKGIEVDPEGPRGRSTGFKTQAGDYESPGAFAGPELSPNFLGLDGYDTSFSLRPGLPSFGGNPTGVLAKTDVRRPDADTMDGFRDEMLDRAGETTARTKPARSSELNTGEAEAVIPPEARFERVGSGWRGALERFGIGSRFYTEIGGRRVPLRPVAPDRRRGPDAPDSTVDVDAPDGRSGSGEPLDYYTQRPSEAVDRPLPVFAGPSGQPQGQQSDPFASVQEDIRGLFGGGRRVTSGEGSGTSRPESGSDGRTRDGQYVPSDEELPGDWRRKKPEEYGRGSGSDRRDRDRRRSGSPRRDDRGRRDPDRGRPSYPDERSGGSRVSESNRRVTSEDPPSSSPPSGGSGGGSSVPEPPSYNPPEIYPPTSTYGPPSYGTPSPTGGPPEYTSDPPGSGVPYNPVLEFPNQRLRRDLDNEEEQVPEQQMLRLGYWGQGWVNPVAEAQQATSAIFGSGGGDLGLGAVEEDLKSLR